MEVSPFTQTTSTNTLPNAQTAAPNRETMFDVKTVLCHANIRGCVCGTCAVCLCPLTFIPYAIDKLYKEIFAKNCIDYASPPFRSKRSLAWACFNPRNSCRCDPNDYLLSDELKFLQDKVAEL